MALSEIFGNTVSGGAITTLGAAIATTGTTSITTSAAAPAGLQTANTQFRILIDSEIMIVTAGSATTTWTVTRGAEGTTAATHLNGASIYQPLTAAALGGQADPAVGTPGLRSRVSLDPLYAPQAPNLVFIAGKLPTDMTAVGALGSSQRPFGHRVIVPKAGTLHDFTVWIAATSGNIAAAVYDTNDAVAGSRTLLWSSGSVAAGTANSYQIVGDPALTVTAGQQLDFVFAADNVTATFGRMNAPANVAIASLPTNFWPAAGGASPKIGPFQYPAITTLTFASTVTEANVTTNNSFPVAFARVA